MWLAYIKSNQEATKVVSLVKNGGISTNFNQPIYINSSIWISPALCTFHIYEQQYPDKSGPKNS